MNVPQTVRVSSKHQIALPSAARRELGIQAGDELLVDVCGKHLIIMPKPRTPEEWARGLAELGSEVWKGVDTERYRQEERDSWAADADSSRP